MFDEGILHFDGTHPDAADFQHVVRAPRVPAITLRILVVLVAGSNPAAFDRRLGFLVLVPVARTRRVAADQQVPDLSGGHIPVLFVDDARLVAVEDPAARPRTHVARTIGAEAVENLGRPDAVENLHPEACLEALEERRRGRLPRRYPRTEP